MAHSYSPNGGWYVMVIPESVQMQTLSAGKTHFSPLVVRPARPLVFFFGAPFTPGIYHGRVQPVDLAATLASVLGLTQPSASVGKVLTQAIHTLPTPFPLRARGAQPAREAGYGAFASPVCCCAIRLLPPAAPSAMGGV